MHLIENRYGSGEIQHPALDPIILYCDDHDHDHEDDDNNDNNNNNEREAGGENKCCKRKWQQ